MKTIIIRLDDAGSLGPAQLHSLVARSLSTMTPLCIGMRGVHVERLPNELVLLLRHAIGVGVLEVWSHGYLGTLQPRDTESNYIEDVVRGHKVSRTVLDAEPSGYIFRNGFDARLAALLEEQHADQKVFESEFQHHTFLTIGRADLNATKSWFDGLKTESDIVLHGRVHDWSTSEFIELDECIARAGVCGYLPVSTSEARALANDNGSASAKYILDAGDNKAHLDKYWRENSGQFTGILGNFESYYLSRFVNDTEKNYLQMRRAFFPQVPTSVLDIGCGLGNWSLGFAFYGSARRVILNDVDATITRALQDGLKHIDASERFEVRDDDLLANAAHSGINVDFLVCANTFNYLDPTAYFQLCQTSIVPGGLMLLMVQTIAFNKMRFRVACRTRNRSVGADVLRTELGMIVRRMGLLFPVRVRHIFDRTEIEALARLFGFALQSTFVPLGEERIDGIPVYECYVFRHSTDLADPPQPPSTESIEVINRSFGSRAMEVAGVTSTSHSKYPRFDDEWALPETQASVVIRGLKDALERLQKGDLVPYAPPCASGHPDIDELVNKTNKFIRLLGTPK